MLASMDGPLHRFAADGMYDNATVYNALADHQDGVAIDIVVPPRRTAAPSQTAQSSPTQRDIHIAAIQSEGIFALYRYKAVIG